MNEKAIAMGELRSSMKKETETELIKCLGKTKQGYVKQFPDSSDGEEGSMRRETFASFSRSSNNANTPIRQSYLASTATSSRAEADDTDTEMVVLTTESENVPAATEGNDIASRSAEIESNSSKTVPNI